MADTRANSTMRHAPTGQYGYGPFDSQPPATPQAQPGQHGYAPQQGGDRLNDLKHAISAIERRIGGLDQAQAPAFQQTQAPAYQPAPAYQQPSYATSPQQGYAPQPGYAASQQQAQPQQRAGMLQERLNRLAGQIGTAVPAPGTMAHPASQQRPQPQMQQPDLSAPISAIAEQLSALKAELSGLKSEVAKPVSVKTSVPQEEIDRIAQSIAELQRAEKMDDKSFERLSGELAAMRNALRDEVNGALARQTNSNAAREQQASSAMDGRLDALANQIEQGIAGVRDAASRSQAMDPELVGRLDGLSRGLDALSHHAAATVGPQVDELAARIDSMRAAMEELPRQMQAQPDRNSEKQTTAIMRLEDQLGAITDRIAHLTDAATTQATAQEHLLKKAQELSRVPAAQPMPEGLLSQDDLAAIEGRLEEIARAVVAVSNTSRKAPEIDLSAIERIEARMADLGRTVGAMAERPAQHDPALTSMSERMEARLAELSRSVDTILETAAHPATPQIDPAMEALSTRIEGLTERLGSFEKYAQSGDLGGANALFAAPDTGQIEAQLRELNLRIDEASSRSVPAANVQNLETQLAALSAQLERQMNEGGVHLMDMPANTDALERQLAELTARFEEASATHSTAAQMSNLEAQVGQIMRTMAANDGGFDFAPLEERLAGIEGHLSGSSSVALEAAQAAVQQTMAQIDPGHEQSGVVQALAADLRSLQQIAEGGYAETAQTTRALQDTLAAVMERLGAIEDSVERGTRTIEARVSEQAESMRASVPYGMAAGASAPLPRARNLDHAPGDDRAHRLALDEQSEQTVFAADALAEASGAENTIARVAQETGFVAAPSLDPVDDLEAGFDRPAEDHLPLEPGSPPPDVERLIREASERLNGKKPGAATSGAPKVTGDVRPDAVAAARRALQATSAEIESIDGAITGAKAAGRKGRKARVAKEKGESKSVLAPMLAKFDTDSLRKPVVMAAAAVLIALLGYQGYRMMAPSSVRSVATVDMSAPASTTADEPAVTIIDSSSEADVADVRQIPLDGDAASDDVPTQMAQTDDPDADVMAEPRLAADPIDDTAALADTAAETAAAALAPIADAGSDALSEAGAVAFDGQQPPAATDVPLQEASLEPAPAPAAEVPALPTFAVPVDAGPTELVKAASAGDPMALFEVAMRYSNGRGVSRDMTAAARWFAEAAELGFAPAQYSYGSLLEKGIGADKDIVAAAAWYEKAAAQGNARAMHNLAVIRAMGNPPSVQPDMDAAIVWFKQAADLNVKDSQFNLGILYGQGMGVPQNLDEAYKWFAIAAKSGDTDAAKKRDEVADAMRAGELRNAKAGVSAWKAQPLEEAANRVTIPAEWKGTAAVSNGVDREAVKQAQTMLNQRGFAVGTPDGLVGPKTTRAIMEFQKSAGLGVTGKVDPTLLKALSI